MLTFHVCHIAAGLYLVTAWFYGECIACCVEEEDG